MITTIPFSGFYDSVHDDALDYAADQMFQHRETGEPRHDLTARLHFECRWREVCEAYAKAYCEAFAAEFGIDLQFESLNSPREYNFTTDRIFATIDLDEVNRLLAEISMPTLRLKAKERFTSCSGFMSNYSPDVEDWGDVETWDHNQVGTLIEAWAEEQATTSNGFDSGAEFSLMERYRDNNCFESWIAEATPGIDRLYRIADYLNTREERAA